MKKPQSVLKTTLIGGVIFLVPLVVVAVIVGKAVGLMRRVAVPISGVIPVDTMAGVAVADILAVILVLALCLLAGMAARSGMGVRMRNKINEALLNIIPGYAFVKGMADSMDATTKVAEGFEPVLVRFDDNAQIGFEVERTPSNDVVVYLPGAPNPWSGTVGYFSADRVRKLDITVVEAIKHIQHLGRGAGAYSERQ